MKRFISSFVALATIITTLPFGAIPTAAAAQTNWAWSDISDYVTYRTNRPVWAMAHANNGWFFTDGIDLWNGGQVYRFDGTTNVTITTDVRSAGLTRVDDIVSDGADTVLFLQDVVRLDNQFRIVVSKNGSFYNATNIVRGMLAANEGISQIKGMNGTWRMITTNGRLFSWNANLSAPTEITLPSRLRSTIQTELNASTSYRDGLLYTVNDENALQTIDLSPITSDRWLLRVSYEKHSFCLQNVCDKTYRSKWYVLSGNTTFNEVTTLLPQDHYTAILDTNGSEVLIANSDLFTTSLFSFNGISVTHQKSTQGLWSVHTAEWTGSSWMLIQNYKTVYQYNPSNETLLSDATRDYFITASTDRHGRTLLGGVVSTLGNPNPTFPLIAKLVNINESSSNNTSEDNTNNQSDEDTGIHAWEWLDPEMPDINDGQETAYHVGAWDTDGIQRMDIYVNGIVQRTCLYPNSLGNQECSLVISGNSYPNSADIFINAKITDAGNRTTWTEGKHIWKNGTSSNTTDDAAWSTSWFSPSVSTIKKNESVEYHVKARDNNGIDRLTIFVNGIQRQNCYPNGTTGDTECSYRIYANDYLEKTTISVNTRIIDKNGVETWTDLYSVYREDSSSTSSESDGWSTVWLTPETTNLDANESTEFHVQAQDNDGINRITIFVNGIQRQNCYPNGTTSNTECSYRVYAKDHPKDTEAFVNARIIDAKDTESWSDDKRIWINGDSEHTNRFVTTGWIDGKKTLNEGETTLFRSESYASEGLERVDIYVNGSIRHTCNYNNALESVRCDHQIYEGDYPNTTTLNIQSRAVAKNKKETWSEQVTVSRSVSSSDTTNDNSSENTINAWEWLEPDPNGTLRIGERTTYSVGSWSEYGIKSVTIFVNGTEKKTCRFSRSSSNRNCVTDIEGSNYPLGTSVFVNARITDYADKQTWTEGTNIQIENPQEYTNENTNGWINVSSNRDEEFSKGDSVTITANGGDEDGIARIELYANGNLIRTCKKSTTCTYWVWPSFTDTYFTYGAILYDVNGNKTETGYKQISRSL